MVEPIVKGEGSIRKLLYLEFIFYIVALKNFFKFESNSSDIY